MLAPRSSIRQRITPPPPTILAVHYERHVSYIQVVTSEGVILQELSRLVGAGGEGVKCG